MNSQPTPNPGCITTRFCLEPGFVEEWAVTGDPGDGYPPYEFIWRGPDAERDARTFLIKIKTREPGSIWNNGPHLFHRIVEITKWELADTSSPNTGEVV